MTEFHIFMTIVISVVGFVALGVTIEELNPGRWTMKHIFVLIMSLMGWVATFLLLTVALPKIYHNTTEKINESFRAQALAVYQYQHSLEK